LLKRRLNDYEIAAEDMDEIYELAIKVWNALMEPKECQMIIEIIPKCMQRCIKIK
jgi:hypothetical protein